MPIIEYESQRQSFNEDEVIEQFAELIRRSEKAKTNQNLRSVIAKLEENIRDNEKYIIKMFLVNNRTGSMINSDNAPNVSFRVDTINNIFDSIVDSLRGLGLSGEQTAEVFFRAGVKCGESFGQTFDRYAEMYLDVNTTDEKISEWCMFDSSVGWGKLSYDPAAHTVSITNNFQTKTCDGASEPPRDCDLFKGYVSGVMSVISPRDKDCRAVCAGECPKKTECRECVFAFDSGKERKL